MPALHAPLRDTAATREVGAVFLLARGAWRVYLDRLLETAEDLAQSVQILRLTRSGADVPQALAATDLRGQADGEAPVQERDTAPPSLTRENRRRPRTALTGTYPRASGASGEKREETANVRAPCPSLSRL